MLHPIAPVSGLVAAVLLAGCVACGVGGAGEGALPTVAADPERMPPQPCFLAELSATATPVTPDGTVHITIVNGGTRACTLRGTPVVTIVDAGLQLRAVGGSPSSATGPTATAVRLDPRGSGADAVTTVHLDVTGPAADCHPVTTLRLSIPGSPDPAHAPLTVPLTATVCDTAIAVDAFAHT